MPVPIESPAEPPPSRVYIEDPQPMLDCGRYPVKACAGDRVPISATIFRDGAELIRAAVRYRGPGEEHWRTVAMERTDAADGGDRWEAVLVLDAPGEWRWWIEAWPDAEASWLDELERKRAAGQEDLAGELADGARLLGAAAERARGSDREALTAAAAALADSGQVPGEEVMAICRRYPDLERATRMHAQAAIDVDRERARFGAWYELFPRSWGGFAGVAQTLPKLAQLGFDVVYLTPIHPIGVTRRKGANNALTAAPGDPGSPWAIGGVEGGHTAVHPDLGSLEDFDALIAVAERAGVEIALDLAIQCSADHPWLTEHPEWFHRRPDGTLKFAENPPKRYEDIYNVNFDCADWRGLWQALRDVVEFWIAHGVRIFRVDNPHTKPFAFWRWLLDGVRAEHPDVLFLAEAFTRAAPMHTLAKLGFDQSYTYFTWKNTRAELEQYVGELASSPARTYLRPNFFVNTPDILSEYLQHGGRAAFEVRLVLAATMSPSYGVYSGFEHCEAVPVRPGSEEYRDSEKYEVRDRALDGPLLGLLARLNHLRRTHPALAHLDNIAFLEVENDALIAYLKRTGDDTLLVVVNLDPHAAQEGVVVVGQASGLPHAFAVEDLLGGERYDWRLGRNYVRLDPAQRVAHVLRVEA